MSPWRGSKRDGNHAAIVQALRDAGRTVLDLSAVGGGCPDILVGWCGWMILLEIKNPEGRNRVAANQTKWHATWRGPVPKVVRSVAEALWATGIRT